MASRIEQPCPTVCQVSGNDPDGRTILSVLVKRTYLLSERGDCQVAPAQPPLREDAEFDPDEPAKLLHDADIFPFKPRTDVVVKGHAQGYQGRPSFEAVVRVGAASKRIAVFGDRHCTMTPGGKITISNPAPIETIPLAYTHAYGGRDAIAEAAAADQIAAQMAGCDPSVFDVAHASPFLYPRNPCGRGYLMTASPAALEALRLPNLEDPLDLLAPHRLEAQGPLYWPRMPLPQATDWVNYEWFPRVAALGIVAPYARSEQPFAESARNFVAEKVLKPTSLETTDPFHLTCGASLGLQLPYLRGGESLELLNIHPKRPAFKFELPAAPKIWTDGRNGKFNQTDPVLQTVLVEPDDGSVTLIWRGTAPALRPYLPDELAKMPLRVEW